MFIIIYVISDIHGCSDDFFKMLKVIELKVIDTLYILGDIVDRGDGAFEIIDYIKDKENIKFIMGNHEDMMIRGLAGDMSFFNCWIRNGGGVTYGQFEEMSKSKQSEILSYLENLKLYEEITVNKQSYFLVHAGLNIPQRLFKLNNKEIIKLQNEQDFLWSRDEFYTKKALGKKTKIVFGHCSTYEINARTTKYTWDKLYIWHDKKYKDKIGIDCGSSMRIMGGRLGCLRLDDMKEFYV